MDCFVEAVTGCARCAAPVTRNDDFEDHIND
jgi:hypothetical protein